MNTNEIINKFLNGEKILWQAHPKKPPLLHRSDIFIIPITILFGGSFLLYSLITALLMFAGKSTLFSLVGITFFIIGAYILLFRLWYRRKRISRELYFITEKRVFAFDRLRDNVIFDIPLNEVELYSGDKSLLLSDTNPLGDFIYDLGLDVFFRKFCKETPAFKYVDDINEIAKIITQYKEIAEERKNDELFI